MTKTLASLALLKVTWDTYQRDFIDIFVLFIITLFNRKGYDFADSDDLVICADFEAEFGFSLPYHPMITVLKRATKHGYFKRSYGKFYPVWDKIKQDDISEIAEEQEAKHKYIIEDFVQFCADEYDETLSREDADKALISFLRDHDLDILFAVQDGSTVLPPVNTSASHRFLMFQFISHVIDGDPLVFSFIVAISIGHLIANTMLIREYSQMQGKLKKANVYLDTGFLFKVSGANGIPMREAYKEWVQLAHSQGVSLFVFRHTFGEFLNILESCLHFIENDRFDPSKANRALLYFRDQGWSASDIEEFILHIEEDLASSGIEVIDPPDIMTATHLQIDEKALQEIIVEIYKNRNPNFIEEEKEYSIYKDVESITYVYKLRKGHLPRSLAQVRHVFVTTNSALAFASQQYEHKESGVMFHYIPAALTDVFLGTMLWIRSPSRAQINEKRLIALAYAATMPSGPFREGLVKKAKDLQKRGSISEVDVVLLTESRIARNLLHKETLGNPKQLSEDKLVEALERIRSEIRQEETETFRSAREALEARAHEAEKQTRKKEEEKHRQQELTRLHWKELVRIKEHLDNKAKKRVNKILWLGFFVLLAFCVLVWMLTFKVGWNVAEPYFSLLLSFVPFLFLYLYFIIAKREWNPATIYEKIVESVQMRNYTEVGFDLARFQELQANADGE
jgi:hypothetical protein